MAIVALSQRVSGRFVTPTLRGPPGSQEGGGRSSPRTQPLRAPPGACHSAFSPVWSPGHTAVRGSGEPLTGDVNSLPPPVLGLREASEEPGRS